MTFKILMPVASNLNHFSDVHVYLGPDAETIFYNSNSLLLSCRAAM